MHGYGLVVDDPSRVVYETADGSERLTFDRNRRRVRKEAVDDAGRMRPSPVQPRDFGLIMDVMRSIGWRFD